MLPHSLPAAIESTLRDAGFSATEILIIRKMLEHDALTLRELAMKTGKSTGVLDQAIKHLITRKIIERVVINSVPKYALKSLRAIGTWLREDMTEKQASLRRRHDNMEKFLSSLSLDRHRPDMEYFEGRAGIQEAYDRLLATRAEFLTRSNPTTLVEEDPLREMRVQLFRRRQVHHVFQRVLSPDTHFARRHQSRDHFEYRSTQLLPPVHTSSQMEVTIAGDLICCIDVQEERACIIRYPELAKDEKERFEREWAEAVKNNRTQHEHKQIFEVPLSTRIASALRECLLGKKGLPLAITFALMCSIITFGLQSYVGSKNLKQIQQYLERYATISAQLIDPNDVEAIHTRRDIHLPSYEKLISKLRLIRRYDADIQYVYIMRKTEDPGIFSFVADADSFNPDMQKDINLDGKIDEVDALNFPGESYSIDGFPIMQEAFEKTVSGFGVDQWGKLFSAFSPIHNNNHDVIAILGIDLFAERVDELSQSIFPSIIIFIGLLFLFMILRFCFTNRSLIKEILQTLNHHRRISGLSMILATLAILLSGMLFQSNNVRRSNDDMGRRLMAWAIDISAEFNPDDIMAATSSDGGTIQSLTTQLSEVRSFHPEISRAAIIEYDRQSASSYHVVAASTPVEVSNSHPDNTHTTTFTHPAYDAAGQRATYSIIKHHPLGKSIVGLAPIWKNNHVIGILELLYKGNP